jgi:L-alanine-DL-glutamate epimerase-like enolase superfamily enzyme
VKITRIAVFSAALPISGGYSFAKGKSVATADTTVVRIDTDADITGWGEACPLGPFYLPSYAEGVRTGLSVLAPHLIGLDPRQIGALNRKMDRELRGHPYVKSAIDVAAHDILGKAGGLPVYALLGGRQMEAAPMYWSVSQGDPDDMRRAVARARQQGYSQFQLKVGGDPATDIERIRAGMDGMRPGETFLCDANTGWRRDEALKVAFATEDLDYILEQPCELYADNLSVRRRVRQTLKLDESLQTPESISQALADDACDVVCIKITKMGGLTKSRFARDLLAAHGIPMTVEDVWGAEIVTAALGHLAISTAPEAILNTTDLHSYNEVHIATGARQARQGQLWVSDAPGLGVEPDLAMFDKPVAAYG